MFRFKQRKVLKRHKTKPKEANGDYFKHCILGHNPGCLHEIHFSLEQTIVKELNNLFLLTKQPNLA